MAIISFKKADLALATRDELVTALVELGSAKDNAKGIEKARIGSQLKKVNQALDALPAAEPVAEVTAEEVAADVAQTEVLEDLEVDINAGRLELVDAYEAAHVEYDEREVAKAIAEAEAAGELREQAPEGDAAKVEAVKPVSPARAPKAPQVVDMALPSAPGDALGRLMNLVPAALEAAGLPHTPTSGGLARMVPTAELPILAKAKAKKGRTASGQIKSAQVETGRYVAGDFMFWQVEVEGVKGKPWVIARIVEIEDDLGGDPVLAYAPFVAVDRWDSVFHQIPGGVEVLAATVAA